MNISQADSLILAIPCVAMLALFVFRLDTILSRSQAKQADARSQRRRFANFESTSMLMTDPDGRVSQPARTRSRVSHRLIGEGSARARL
ncbi:MAG: hypothetical protein WCF17_02060 [Terracidiphilus sp.]